MLPEVVLTGYSPVPDRSYDEFFTYSARRGIADFNSLEFLTGRNESSSKANPYPRDGLVEAAVASRRPTRR